MSEEAPTALPPATMQFVEGCPGCAMERKKLMNNGIPYKELYFVAITSIATALPISALFPSLYFMVTFNTLFGLSVKCWMAMTTRLLLGALNGMLAPIKAYSIEVCPAEHQALGLSIVSTGWGIGLVIGPSIGGYFARPALQYPNIFSEKSLFGRFPYFLPCLSISMFSVAVLIFCIWLPE